MEVNPTQQQRYLRRQRTKVSGTIWVYSSSCSRTTGGCHLNIAEVYQVAGRVFYQLKKPDEHSIKAQKHITICKRYPPSNVQNGEGAKETQCFSFGSRHLSPTFRTCFDQFSYFYDKPASRKDSHRIMEILSCELRVHFPLVFFSCSPEIACSM